MQCQRLYFTTLFWVLMPYLLRAQRTDFGGPGGDGTLDALVAVAGHGMVNGGSYRYLEELSDGIGGRLTGSQELSKALEWAVWKMHQVGLQNVHIERWQLSRGWKRVSAKATLMEPVEKTLTVDSMGWVGSTPKDGVTGQIVVVDQDQLDTEMRQNSQHWANKILLLTTRRGVQPRNMAYGPFLQAAYAARALAIIFSGEGGSSSATGMHLTHTGAFGSDNYYEIPVVSIVAEDQHLLERLLAHSKVVKLKLIVQNEVTDGPVTAGNVVGEIVGSEYPDQIVVIGGHLDSWDLGAGSADDGVGVAAALGAAEAILRSEHRPRRTIRFVLFSGEEQGLVGSYAYTKLHREELPNHVATVVLDNGEGPVLALMLGGRDDLIPVVSKFTDLLTAFGDLRVDGRADFGTDAGPFILAGLPAISMDQESAESPYTHHSAVDTFEKVKPDILARNTTVVALTGFWIADRPQRLATPWPPEKIVCMLTERGIDQGLKIYGRWPFGDLSCQDRK